MQARLRAQLGDWSISSVERRRRSVVVVPNSQNHNRPSPRLDTVCTLLSPSCAALRLRRQDRLHGVSHHSASPMPTPPLISVFPMVFHRTVMNPIQRHSGGGFLGSVDKYWGHRNKKHKKTAFCRCQCFAPVVGAVACLISSWGLNQPHHNPNATLLRGRWHRQKDKNRSPSAKNQTR